jgi:hypothetical protein
VNRFAPLVAAGALIAGVAAAPAAAMPPDFTVTAVQTSHSGSPPQTFSFKEKLLRHHHVVGHDSIDCHAISDSKLRCRGTFTFHNGTITAVATVHNGAANKGAILSGTGAYHGAQGTIFFRGIAHNRTRETFQFS